VCSSAAGERQHFDLALGQEDWKKENKLVTIGTKIDEIRIDGNLSRFRNDLEKFASLGLEAVEIPVHGVDAIRNGILDRSRLQSVLEVLREFDFRYSVHSPNPLNLMDEEDFLKHYSVFQASLEFAGEIGAGVLVYHAGRFIPEEAFCLPQAPRRDSDREKRLLDQEREALWELAEEFPEVLIAVENARPYLYHSPYCYGERIDLLNDQVREVNRPNVQITLDVGHLFMSSRFHRFDPEEAARSMKDLIVHTHVHDNFGGAIYYNQKTQTHQIPLGKGDSHMPVGWGSVPFSSILSTFLHSYSGLIIMELRSRYFTDLNESKANLIQLINHLNRLPAMSPEVALGPGRPAM
jgi:sugar phosphate isomerase/epimerase